MKTRLANLWEKVHTSYWFVPTVMIGLAIILAFGMIWLDLTYIQGKRLPTFLGFTLLYGGGMDGARELLSTIAGSVIAIAGVTFSITIVALSLASSQYGPLVLRNYMRSTGSQIVMGIFVGTFIYCLLVLRAIEGNGEEGLQLQVSITLAVILALASIYAFVYFIHHEAESIYAESVTRAAWQEMRYSINFLYPEHLGRQQVSQRKAPDVAAVLEGYEDRQKDEVFAKKAGYLQAVNGEKLMDLAKEHDLLLYLHCKPGDFLTEVSPVMRCYSRQAIDDELKRKLKEALLIGTKRTPEQDTAFTINELVQIALRALSPSLNDPFTAMACIDYLGAGLSVLAGRAFPSHYRYDKQEQLRVIARATTFEELFQAAFYQISYNCGPQEAVRRHLLATLESMASQLDNESRRQAIARMIAEVRLHGGQG